MVDNAKKGYLQSFAFIMKSKNEKDKKNKLSGHQILIVGYSKEKSNKKRIALKIYDNSYSNEDRYLYVSRRYNKFRLQGWSDDKEILSFSANTDFGRYKSIKID